MQNQFNLPNDVRFSEECGLNLTFQDITVRGTKESYCQVLVTEHGESLDVQDTYTFTSWEEMKQTYPHLLDFLHELSNNELWSAEWRDNDRIFFIASSQGHEGLYDISETVWFDAQEEENEVG